MLGEKDLQQTGTVQANSCAWAVRSIYPSISGAQPGCSEVPWERHIRPGLLSGPFRPSDFFRLCNNKSATRRCVCRLNLNPDTDYLQQETNVSFATVLFLLKKRWLCVPASRVPLKAFKKDVVLSSPFTR